MCGALAGERAGRVSDADWAEMMRRIREETYYLRNEVLGAKADNEQLTYKLKETIAELRGERNDERSRRRTASNDITRFHTAAPKGSRVGEHQGHGQREQTLRGAEGPARKPNVEVISDPERRFEARSIHVPSLRYPNLKHGTGAQR